MPDISVVIPAMGKAPVARAVASVVESAAAGGVDAEVIVVWQAPAEPAAMPGARVVAVHEVNVSYARNRGADEASAPLIGYIDDDEMADPSWVAAAVAALADVDAAFGPVDPLDDEGRPHCYLGERAERVHHGYAVPWEVGTGGSMAFRREALVGSGAFDLRLGGGSVGLSAEESEIIWRLLDQGRRVRWAPGMAVYHPTKTDAEILASRYPYGFGTGRVLRRARSPRLLATSGWAIVHANAAALRSGDPQRRREASRYARGVFDGLLRRRPWHAPDLSREPVPPAIRDALGNRVARPLPVPWQARPHYIWECEDAVLHAYIGPTASHLGAPAAREAIRALPGATRIPAVLAHARGRDALWVLEERVEGQEPDIRRVSEWWPQAADWIRRYGHATGRPMRETDEWRAEAENWVAGAPPQWRAAVAEAVLRTAETPAAPAHGDLQPKNLVLGPNGATAIDWEWASMDALRGLDLLLLAATHAGVRPDEDVLVALAAGRNPPFGDVLGPLRDVGLEGAALKDTLLVILAKWAANERTRHAQLGSSPQAATYGPMFERVAPLVAAP